MHGRCFCGASRSCCPAQCTVRYSALDRNCRARNAQQRARVLIVMVSRQGVYFVRPWPRRIRSKAVR